MDKVFLRSEKGYFGEGEFKFGGCFIPEILYPALNDLQKAYKQIFQTKGFQKKLRQLFKTFVGRPTPLIYAKNASEILGNEIYLKFEGLANTGAHKINNALAQVLLAKRMKKQHIIAETGAGQHGVAVASVCAFLKIPCTIFMGATDIQRQRPNVFIMEQFGAEVIAVESGTKTLKDAVNEALRQWSKSPHEYFYVLGSALGPYPYPDIVRDSQAIIGKEIKKQIREVLSKYANVLLPDYIIACVGGGSNSIGAFSAFLEDTEVQLVGVEAGGDNFTENKHAMRLSESCGANIGIAHGFRSYFLQDKHGQIANTHSISAGLDYAGVGPQLAHLSHVGRVRFIGASDDMALEAMQFFARHEGILPALESSHALAGAIEISKQEKNKVIVVNVSGRGDKDIFITAKALCAEAWRDFLESELQSVEKIIRQKNKSKETIAKEEEQEEANKKSIEEFLIALKDISHDDLSFFDSVDSEDGEDMQPVSAEKLSDCHYQDDIDMSLDETRSDDSEKIKQEYELSIMQDSNSNTSLSSDYENKDLLHFLTQDSDNMESESGENKVNKNREALRFLQEKELQDDKNENLGDINQQNQADMAEYKQEEQEENKLVQDDIQINSSNESESISLESLLDCSDEAENNDDLQDGMINIPKEHNEIESVSETLDDGLEISQAKNELSEKNDILTTDNTESLGTLAQQLSFELHSMQPESTQESLQTLEILANTNNLDKTQYSSNEIISVDNTEQDNQNTELLDNIDSIESIDLENPLETQLDIDLQDEIAEKKENFDSMQQSQNINTESTLNPDLMSFVKEIDSGSEYSNVNAFDDMLGLQDSSDAKDDLNPEVFELSIQESISNDLIQDTNTQDSILQKELQDLTNEGKESNDILVSELPFDDSILLLDENVNQNSNVLDSENNIQNEIKQDESINTQEIEQRLESYSTDSVDTKDSDYDNQSSTSNNTLSYAAINSTSARVFKTDPELSKICGKSLKS